jgi:transcriptional regulator with XRE-family HTH domain
MLFVIREVLECHLVMAERIKETQDYLRKFGDKLRLLRLERKLTQGQLAERAGLHRTFIGQLELGRRGINLATLPRLAQALNLDDPRELLP